VGRQHGQTRVRGSLSAVLALAIAAALTGPLPLGALTQTTISIDGAFADWSPVLADSDNTLSDPSGPADPDPVNDLKDRDISLLASTWDSDYFYLYVRRTETAQTQIRFWTYFDLDHDGLMEDTDLVLEIRLNRWGDPKSYTLMAYDPDAVTGDPLTGDGETLPGTTGDELAGASVSAATEGIEMEARVAWSSLGFSPPHDAGHPMQFKQSCGLAAALPEGVNDNTDIVSLRRRGLTLVPDRYSAGLPGDTLTYTHTLTNTGNDTEVFELAATSSEGWAVSLDGGGSTMQVTLAPGGSVDVQVGLAIPVDASFSVTDRTSLSATLLDDPAYSATVTDSTNVGVVSLSPDQTAAGAEGTDVDHTFTLTNISGEDHVFDLSATDGSGWPVSVLDPMTGDPLTAVSVAAGASTQVMLRVPIPSGTPPGTISTSTLRAALQSDPTAFGEARAVTVVRLPIDIEPDRTGEQGAGQAIQYAHTVTNASDAQQTVSLSASSSQGWTVQILDASATQPITTLDLAPNGGSADVTVRVTVPAGVAQGTVDQTTVTASAGAHSDQVVDSTTVVNLATYSDSAFSQRSDSFAPADRVYARGMGLFAYSRVVFSWYDPMGGLAHQSPDIGVDSLGTSAAYLDLADDAAEGTWEVVLTDDDTGAEIARHAFQVAVPSVLTMSVDTTVIDFGLLDPSTPSDTHTVNVTVESNRPYALSRSIAGDAALMGLSVTGEANGDKPAGTDTHADAYQATVSWDADAGVPLEASVAYTVVPY
jgi:hypothetical protein